MTRPDIRQLKAAQRENVERLLATKPPWSQQSPEQIAALLERRNQPRKEAHMQQTCNYFGCCPRCGGCDGYLNVGRAHWFVCEGCQTTWLAGSNLFSGWLDESREVWDQNADKLASFEIVSPSDCQCSDCQEQQRFWEQQPRQESSSADAIPF